MKPVYSVDWDGCLAVEAWPGLGQWLPGAVDALQELCERGTVLIHSCRTAPVEPDGLTWRDPVHVGQEVARMRKMLNLEGLHAVQIWTKPWKPRADAYFDDRAVRFEGDWRKVLDQIKGDRAAQEGSPAWMAVAAATADSMLLRQQALDQIERVKVRQFETGATRNNDHDELDYEAFLSPAALRAYGEYMHAHRFQADGEVRPGDNWQKGIPQESYVKSLVRHTMDVWLEHRGHESREGLVAGLCGVIFNAHGLLHELTSAQAADSLPPVSNTTSSSEEQA